jgi:hypothetical protein
MTRARSSVPGVATRLAAAAFILGVLAVMSYRPALAQPSDSPIPGFAVSLVQSAAAVPLDGTMGFSGVIRFPVAASSVIARVQVRRAGGRLVYQRTQYADTVKAGTKSFSFSRELAGLDLPPGTYPVTFSLRADVGASSVDTEVAQVVRVFDPSKTPVPMVLLVKVHARPLANTDGGFAVDPASPEALRPRDEVDRVATMVAGDPSAHVTLAIAPEMLAEWRQIATNGYSTASGTAVPAADPVAAGYGTALSDLQGALASGRLELAALGCTDPSLADLVGNKLTGDAAVQYDAGFSAVFAALETTPSTGTAPAGAGVPAAVQKALLARRVTSAFVDADSARQNKRPGVASGVYPCADSTLTALVVDAKASRGLESGDASATLARTFERYGGPGTSQAVVARIDLDDSAWNATATVGAALSTLQATPWTQLVSASQVKPPRGTKPLTFPVATTKNAPAKYWQTVRSARARAIGMIDVLTTADDQATSAQTNSLMAEDSYWSEPSARWRLATSGLSFARAAIDTANGVFSQIKMSATSVTLAGSTGQVPVTITNASKKTLSVVVLAKTSGGMTVVGGRSIPTKLPPSDTLVEIPVDMQSTLYGRLTVQVMAGGVVISHATVAVRRSYLDRLVLIGGIVVVLGGMLVWIVARVRRAPDLYENSGSSTSHSDVDDADAHARYTGSARAGQTDSDPQ